MSPVRSFVRCSGGSPKASSSTAFAQNAYLTDSQSSKPYTTCCRWLSPVLLHWVVTMPAIHTGRHECSFLKVVKSIFVLLQKNGPAACPQWELLVCRYAIGNKSAPAKAAKAELNSADANQKVRLVKPCSYYEQLLTRNHEHWPFVLPDGKAAGIKLSTAVRDCPHKQERTHRNHIQTNGDSPQ